MPNKAGDRSVRRFMRHKVGMVPRMRPERGIHNDLSVQDNLSMGYLNARAKTPFISARAEAERFARQYGVALTDLIAANPQIKNPNLIYPGNGVRLP